MHLVASHTETVSNSGSTAQKYSTNGQSFAFEHSKNTTTSKAKHSSNEISAGFTIEADENDTIFDKLKGEMSFCYKYNWGQQPSDVHNNTHDSSTANTVNKIKIEMPSKQITVEPFSEVEIFH